MGAFESTSLRYTISRLAMDQCPSHQEHNGICLRISIYQLMESWRFTTGKDLSFSPAPSCDKWIKSGSRRPSVCDTGASFEASVIQPVKRAEAIYPRAERP